jgi:HAE1 family hydrophobic/amphiphilic exporter-1
MGNVMGNTTRRGVLIALFAALVQPLVPAQSDEPLRLTPQRAVEIALDQHPEVRGQRERRNELEAVRGQALANAYPSLEANASTVRNRDPGLLNSPNFGQLVDEPDGGFPGFDPSFLEPIPITTYFYGLTVEQTVYSFGRIPAAVRAAGLRREEISYQISAQEAATARDAVVAVYNLALAQRRLEVLAAERASRERQLEQAEAFLEIGTGTRLQYLQARTALSQLRPREIEARGQEEAARARLNESLGREALAPIEIAPSVLSEGSLGPLPPIERLVARVSHKPSLAALRFEQQSLEQEQKVFRANLLPDLRFSGTYGIRTIFSEELTNTDFASWTVGLFVDWPLYDGGDTRSKMAELRSRQRQSELLEHTQRAEAERDLVATAAEYRRAREAAAIAETVVAEAEETLRIAEENYRLGAATSLDVLDGQRTLTQARFDRLQAVHDALVARADLHAVLGLLPFQPFQEEDPS